MSINAEHYKNKTKNCNHTAFFDNKNDIINWLEKLNIKEYTIDNELVVDVQGDVLLEYCKSFIPVQFGIINGNFNCCDLELSSLKGSPREVYGDFNCSFNKLKSLEHCPLIIQGDFYCNCNLLKSLKGCPDILKGSFNCNHNKLKTLLYCAEEIGGDFSCQNNKLVSLKGCPKVINKNFYCSNNMLTSLEGCPSVINGTLNCCDNKLKSFIFFPEEIKNVLNMNRNCIDKNELINFNTYGYHKIYSDFGDNEDFSNHVRILKINKEKLEIASILNKNNSCIQKRRI